MKVYILLTIKNNYTLSGYCGVFSSEQKALDWIPNEKTSIDRVTFNGDKITTVKTNVALYSITEDQVQE